MVDSRQAFGSDFFLFAIRFEFFQDFIVSKFFHADFRNPFHNLADKLLFLLPFTLLKILDEVKYSFNNIPELGWGKGQATKFLFDGLCYDEVFHDIQWHFSNLRA